MVETFFFFFGAWTQLNTAGQDGPTHKVGEATTQHTGASAYGLTCLVSMDVLAKSGKLHTTMCSEGKQPEPRCGAPMPETSAMAA